jgi:hypothetical protein
VPESLRYTDYSLPVRRLTRERHGRTGWHGTVSGRAAVVSFGLAEVVALGLRLQWARGAWFGVDDWDFLTRRTAGNLGDLFRPHWQHWVTLPVLAYRLLWWFGGLNYLPYELLAIVSHLVAAALLRAVMRRAGVRPWVATATASLFVFIGAGMENLFFSSTIAFAFTHLLLADHEGPVNRRDWLGLGAGVAGLLCSGAAVPLTIAVGLTILLRRGWQIALLHTAPLAGVFLIWSVAAPPSDESVPRATHLTDVIRFVVTGLRTTFGRVGQLPGFGIVLAGILVGGLALLYAQRGTALLSGPTAAPIALLSGAIIFLILTGILRASGSPSLLGLKGSGATGRDSRYTYVVAAMTLPTIAMTADAIIARWRRFAVVATALLVIGLPGHIHKFRSDAHDFARFSNKHLILSAARLPLANQLPRSLFVGSPFTGGPTLGWLLDNLQSGRIPTPGRLTPNDIANVTLQLALTRSTRTQLKPCWTITRPTVRVLHKGDALTLKTGAANIIYTPASGGRSRPEPFPAASVVALAGPLTLRLAPSRSLGEQTVLCG